MKLLLLDTCGVDGSLALADTELATSILAEVTMPGRTSSERLLPEIRGAMARAGWRPAELAAVGVVAGPGSFTGVRIGLAAAKGLCEAASLPLVSLSRLEVLSAKGAGDGGRGQIAVLDAGRGEFFSRGMDAGAGDVEGLLSREQVRNEAGDRRMVVCEEAVRAAFGDLPLTWVEPLSAADALTLVTERVRNGGFSDPVTSDANYLRRTEAEMLAKLRERAAGA